VTRKFPEGFKWGTATASYQIEGAVNQDGRGETIWDRFCQMPGNILHNDSGNDANDHYNRYKQDVALMKELGHNAYRFSVCWSRILPSGRGEMSQEGLQFYSNLVDELLAAGIEPFLTIYHWDLPQALQDIGGWQNDDIIDYFVSYCQILFEKLGGRVKNWITLNEPYCTAFLGNYSAEHAPGIHDLATAIRVSYNILRAHGAAVRKFREMKVPGEIGITLNVTPVYPASDSSEDKTAARFQDGFNNRWFLDPVFKGKFPLDMIELYKSRGITLPDFTDEASIFEDLDFVGINYYFTTTVRYNKHVWPLCAEEVHSEKPYSDRKWPIDPEGFTKILTRINKDYNVPEFYITENGACYNDVMEDSGNIRDYNRIEYLRKHIIAIHHAMEQGVNIRGYFVWTFADNFEWAFGRYSPFGIIHEDFNTHKRTPKQSAYWFRDLIEMNAI
jgi:beta-glucosidase